MKKILAIILAATLCISLFACGETKDAEPTAAPATEAPAETAAPTAEPTEEPTPTPEVTPEPPRQIDLSTVEFSGVSTEDGTLVRMTVADIEDADAKQAFLDAGHAETDVVLYAKASIEDFTNDLTAATQPDMFTAGTMWKMTWETYNAGSSNGYLIIHDGTSGNFLINGGDYFEEGYMVKSSKWTMPDTAISDITCWNAPADLYIIGISVEQVKTPANLDNVYVDNDQIETNDDVLQSDLEAEGGYTWDFKEGNVMDLKDTYEYIKISEITTEAFYDEIRDILTAENGFTDYAFMTTDDKIAFFSIRDVLVEGHTYTFKFRAYCDNIKETLLQSSYGYGHCLQMSAVDAYTTDGHQNGQPTTGYIVTAVDGLTNVYDFTATIEISEGTNIVMCFGGNKTLYISSVSIADVTPKS